jgi:hypothetical protein
VQSAWTVWTSRVRYATGEKNPEIPQGERRKIYGSVVGKKIEFPKEKEPRLLLECVPSHHGRFEFHTYGMWKIKRTRRWKKWKENKMEQSPSPLKIGLQMNKLVVVGNEKFSSMCTISE